MADKTWKACERAIAAKLGGERVPVTGRARGDAPDVATTWASVEVKHRKRLPLWLTEALEQAAASAGDDQLPLVILHQHGCRYDDSIVVMRLSDFVEWHGAVGIEGVGG